MTGARRDEEGAAKRPVGGVVGYAPGVYDMFHIGHLNLLRRARLSCDHLIAGVVSDEVAFLQKNRWPMVPEDERVKIVAALDLVDETAVELTTDKMLTWRSVGFDVIFKGDDWRGSPKWIRLEREFAAVGVTVLYLPYTRHTSSAALRDKPGIRSLDGAGSPPAAAN